MDGNLVSAAGVSSGIDGSLRLAALLAGDEFAQRIQLEIQYAPEPPFAAGTPAQAPESILDSARQRVSGLTAARLEAAKRVADRFRSGGA